MLWEVRGNWVNWELFQSIQITVWYVEVGDKAVGSCGKAANMEHIHECYVVCHHECKPKNIFYSFLRCIHVLCSPNQTLTHDTTPGIAMIWFLFMTCIMYSFICNYHEAGTVRVLLLLLMLMERSKIVTLVSHCTWWISSDPEASNLSCSVYLIIRALRS